MKCFTKKLHFPIVVACVLWFGTSSLAGVIPYLKPGDKAPSFSLQTSKGLLSYGKSQPSDIEGPVIVVAFSNESGFLENLFADSQKFAFDLLEHSPDNAHYIFMFHDNAAFSTNKDASVHLKERLFLCIYQYYIKKWLKYTKEMRRVNGFSNYRQKFLRQNTFYKHWGSKLHFAKFPVHLLGNWIPSVLSQWYGSGPTSGLDQIAIENQQGDVLNVFRRLDARYTWLPSVKQLIPRDTRSVIVHVPDACANRFTVDVKGSLALVDNGHGCCSTFTKVKNAQDNGARGVIVYAKQKDSFEELNCHGKECETSLSIPATFIHNDDGYHLKDVQTGSIYARFQTTNSETFTFGIDGQGRLQETAGMFLYPSMRFVAYHAQWFDYWTGVITNDTNNFQEIPIFQNSLIQTSEGITVDILLPAYKDLLLYKHVELQMSLACPKSGQDSCTHWDHVVRLFVSCQSNQKPGHELGRWIMSYGRRSNSWITPVKGLLPLLKTNTTQMCSFTMVTEVLVMPWVVTVNLRLSSKIRPQTNFSTWRHIEEALVPIEIVDLFTGCFFDENCNKKYVPKLFRVPREIARVKLVATITGQGRDNNNCAGACLTTHHFMINKNVNSTQTKIYKNAAAVAGCNGHLSADENSPLSTKEKWLLEREPWCDGVEVVPWEVDVTDWLLFGQSYNTIEYRAFFDGMDPKPTQDPGSIIMSSYLVYYAYQVL